MEVTVLYLDNSEVEVSFMDGETQIIKVFLRRVDVKRMQVTPTLKPYDLSIFSDKPPLFNIVTAPRED